MKLSAISSANAGRSNNINNNVKKQTNFKGGTGLVNFWQWVDNGGRALQFTMEDMFGTNFPRTYKGAMAGYKYTGKVNIPALLQEALREFLTGPTMCLVPVVVLNSAMKMGGKTANTHVENIDNLSYLMGKVDKSTSKELEKSFYTTCVEDMLKKTAGVETVEKAHVESLVDKIIDYSKITDKKMAKKSLSGIQDTYAGIIKEISDEKHFKGIDFTAAKYSISNASTGSTNFKNYIDYMKNYAHDFSKKFNIKNTSDIDITKINAFRNSWVGKRVGVIASMFAITGICMSVIPKIYTLASGSINPNAKDIYNEAEGKNVKAPKKGVK